MTLYRLMRTLSVVECLDYLVLRLMLILAVFVSLVVTELCFPHWRQSDTERLEGAVVEPPSTSLLPPRTTTPPGYNQPGLTL